MRSRALLLAGQLVVVAVGGSPAVAQSVRSAAGTRPAAQNDQCRAVLGPFTPAGTVAAGTRTTAVTFHGLQDMWTVDTVAAARNLTAFLVARPAVLGSVSAAVSECGRRGCTCPPPPRVPGAQPFRQSSDLLAYGLRADSSAALTALVLFLRERPQLVRRTSDSLRHYGSPIQRRELVAAERNVTAAIARQPR